jgi:uncharacterized membrane protein required for colicin V production
MKVNPKKICNRYRRIIFILRLLYILCFIFGFIEPLCFLLTIGFFIHSIFIIKKLNQWIFLEGDYEIEKEELLKNFNGKLKNDLSADSIWK